MDALASGVVGPLVERNPELAATMDDWIRSDNVWLARSALIHQLSFKQRTDSERLFRYCMLRGGDDEFFIRKAIGWILREAATRETDRVVAFVAPRARRLSGVTWREATRKLPARERQPLDAKRSRMTGRS